MHLLFRRQLQRLPVAALEVLAAGGTHPPQENIIIGPTPAQGGLKKLGMGVVKWPIQLNSEPLGGHLFLNIT